MHSLRRGPVAWILVAALPACGGRASEAAMTNGDDTAANAGSESGAPSTTDSASSVSVAGRVVDASAPSNAGGAVAFRGIDLAEYAAVAGVRVCVNGYPRAACVMTDDRGQYTLTGAPAGQPFYLSYAKAGYDPTLYLVTAREAGATVRAPIVSVATPDSIAR